MSGRGNGWDLSVPFEPKPNTSPDFAQTSRKGNLAPGEDRVWRLYLARQPAISEWTYQMRYCVTEKVRGGVKCKSIPEPIEYKNHKKLQHVCQERRVCVFQNAVCINSQERRETGFKKGTSVMFTVLINLGHMQKSSGSHLVVQAVWGVLCWLMDIPAQSRATRALCYTA